MIPVDKIRPNPDQPRKMPRRFARTDRSIREKGVLEPLLVRFMPRDDCYHIISGERRYHASRAAGLREVPCIEKIADDAETLELALIENLQRKDLTPFEEADGLQRLAEQFRLHARGYRQENRQGALLGDRNDVAARDSGRVAPALHRQRHCLEIAAAADRAPAQRKENAGSDPAHRAGRTDARRSAPRAPGRENAGPRPQPFIFNFRPENEAFKLRIQFRKSNVSRYELIEALRNLIELIEQDAKASAEEGGRSNPAVA